MILSQIRGADVGNSMICVITGLLMRSFAVAAASFQKKFNFKERIFMGVCYSVKSTAVASVAGIIFNESKLLGPEYADY